MRGKKIKRERGGERGGRRGKSKNQYVVRVVL